MSGQLALDAPGMERPHIPVTLPRSGDHVRVWCGSCQSEVRAADVDAAVELFKDRHRRGER